jgi:hypothetical protein
LGMVIAFTHGVICVTIYVLKTLYIGHSIYSKNGLFIETGL